MTQTMQHLQTLVGLGPRPVASPANQATADYIRETFRTALLDILRIRVCSRCCVLDISLMVGR